MTDRELLELAAKAAGDFTTAKYYRVADDLPVVFMLNDKPWNPLKDDGDALRLAVKLRLTIQHNYKGVFCYDNPDFADKDQKMIEVWENDQDPYAATRRAIVRAAAEIGKGMK